MADYKGIAMLATGKLGVANTSNATTFTKLKVTTGPCDVTGNITVTGSVDGVADLAGSSIASTDGSLSTSGTLAGANLVVETVFSTGGTANRSIDAADLASNTNALGAALVGVEDPGGKITATDVEGAVVEIAIDVDTIEGEGITGGSGITASGTIGGGDLGVAIGTLTGDWDPGGTFTLTNLPNPDANSEAANKQYVDTKVAEAASGIDVKGSVDAATTAVLPACTAAGHEIGKTLTADSVGVLTVDGVAIVDGDFVLVKNQATGADNGRYECTTEGTGGVAFVLTRATDSDEDAEVTTGLYIYVEEGTDNGGTAWILTTLDPITVDSTAWVMELFMTAGLIEAGTGMTKTGDTMNVIGGDGMTANADNIEVDLHSTNPGLEIDTAQLRIKIDANKGLVLGAGGISAVPDTAKGMEVGSSGLAVDLEAAGAGTGGLTFDSGEIRINLEANQGLSLGASGLAIDLVTAGADAGGLEFSSGDVQIKTDGAHGIILTSTGAEVEVDAVTIDVGAGGIAVTGVPDQFEVNGTPVGATVTAANLDELSDGSSSVTLHTHDVVAHLLGSASHTADTLANVNTKISDLIATYGAIRDIGVGTNAQKPAAGDAGRFFWETDTDALFYDNGATWDEIVAVAGAHGPSSHTTGTAWRLVYQDASGDEQEFVLGANGTFLESNGASAAPAFRTLVEADITDMSTYILHSLADATNDFLVASGADTFVKKTLAETGAILEDDLDHGNIQGLGDDDHGQYILHSLVTAADDFLVASGSGVVAKQTLAQTATTLEAELDHGEIQGLAGDDHTQYHNDARAVTWHDADDHSDLVNDNLTWSGTNHFNGEVTVDVLLMDGNVVGPQYSATVGSGGQTDKDTLRWDASGQFVRRDAANDKICAVATSTTTATNPGWGVSFGAKIPVIWTTGEAPTAHGENVFVCNDPGDYHKWTTVVPTTGNIYPATSVGTGTGASIMFFPTIRMQFE